MHRPHVLLCLLISLGLTGSDEPALEKDLGAEESVSDHAEPGRQECSACLWREHSKALRLESIKSQILSKLRLKQAPNISRDIVNQLLPKAPPLQQLLDRYDIQGDDCSAKEPALEDDEYHATTETVITMAAEPDPCVQVDGSPKCCFFKFSPKVTFTNVVRAHLWVYLRPVLHASTVYLQILRLKPVTEKGSRHSRIRSLKIDMDSRNGRWQSIDFKHVLQNWFKQPHTNWGIEINVFDMDGNDLAITSPGNGEKGLQCLKDYYITAMASLLTALICASEKSANIARACKREEALFQLLIEEKKGPEKNKKFVQDFKTLADVIIQEVIKHDIGKQFPELASHIAGEESNNFENGLGETITVKVCKTEQATAELISKVLDGNLKAADLLAKCIHEDVYIDGPDFKKLNIDIPLDTIGIWVDPIDSTNQYIKGQLEEKFKSGIHPYGLKSAAVLIGVFDRNSGQPIMGVINVPFNNVDPKLRWRGKYYWGISYNDINIHSIPKQLPAHHNQLSIVMSSSEKDDIKKALAPLCGERMYYASGAGYKSLCTILGLTDAYVCTADTTFKWDTCAPHAILKSLGGGIINLAKALAEVKARGPDAIPELQYKMPDDGAKETEKWANTGGLVAYRSQQHLKAIMNKFLV